MNKYKIPALTIPIILMILPLCLFSQTVLIDGIDETTNGINVNGNVNGSIYYASSFTTGPFGGEISEITIQDAYIIPFTTGHSVYLYSTDGEGNVSNLQQTFSYSSNSSSYLFFNPVENYTLLANTTYWLVVSSTNTICWKYNNNPITYGGGDGLIPSSKYRAKSIDNGASWVYDASIAVPEYGTDFWYFNFCILYNSGQAAIDLTWTGEETPYWNIPGNWDLNVVPTANDNVTIPTGYNNPVIDWNGGVCHNLTIESGASLSLEENGAIVTYGDIINNGSFSIDMVFGFEEWELIGIPVSGLTANIFLGNYLQVYSEVTDTWEYIVDPATPLVPGVGYGLWIQSKIPVFSYSGTPNTGDFSTAFTYTPGAGEDNYGFNLMGNPYPSYINWDDFNEIYGAVYYYDGACYNSWNGIGSGSQYIKPGEGFIIAPGVSGTLDFTNDCREYFCQTKSSNTKENTIVLQAADENYTDELYIIFDDQATENFDIQYDAWKLPTDDNAVGQLFTISNDQRFSLDQRPKCNHMSLGFTSGQSGTFTLSTQSSSYEGVIYLEDLKTNTICNLSQFAYTFDWSITEDYHRFNLHFSPLGLQNIYSNHITICAAGKTLYVNTSQERPFQLFVFDLIGKQLMSKNLQPGKNQIPTNFDPGIYLVTAIDGDRLFSQKVFIK